MRFKNLLLGFLILSSLLFFVVYFYVPRMVTEIKNPLIEKVRNTASHVQQPSSEDKDQRRKPLNFRSYDGTPLSAYIYYSRQDTNYGTIILLHGIRSSKQHFEELSSYLAEQGYNTVALDSRAHGQSGGVHCTFGVKERRDVSALIDLLQTRESIDTPIGLWGQSLGGAISLQAAGTDDRIDFLIVESTFTDFKTIVRDYLQYHTGIYSQAFSNFLVHRAGQIADFDPDDASPIKYCTKIKQPILLVHGNQDQRINVKYSQQNFAQLASPTKEYLVIDGANHLNVWQVGGTEYMNHVLDFIHKNTQSRTSVL